MKTFRGHEFWTWDGNQHPVLSDETGLVLEGPVFCVFQPKSNKYSTFQTNRVASRLFARWLWPCEGVCLWERESVWTSCYSNTHKGNQTTRVLTYCPLIQMQPRTTSRAQIKWVWSDFIRLRQDFCLKKKWSCWKYFEKNIIPVFPQGLLTMSSAAPPARLVHFQLGLFREDVWVPAGNLSYGHAKRLAAEIIQRKVTFALRTLGTIGVKLGPVGQIWPTVSFYLAREARPNGGIGAGRPGLG